MATASGKQNKQIPSFKCSAVHSRWPQFPHSPPLDMPRSPTPPTPPLFTAIILPAALTHWLLRAVESSIKERRVGAALLAPLLFLFLHLAAFLS